MFKNVLRAVVIGFLATATMSATTILPASASAVTNTGTQGSNMSHGGERAVEDYYGE